MGVSSERYSTNTSRSVWDVLDALGYLILRDFQHVNHERCCEIILKARDHVRPRDFGRVVFASMKVEYHGRTLQTEALGFSALTELLDGYMRLMDNAKTRVHDKLRENSRFGHEFAAAMIFVQYHEENVRRHRQTDNIPRSLVGISDGQHIAHQSMPQTLDIQERPNQELVPLPYAKWGILEGIAYELMVRVLHFSLQEIAAIIPFSPTMKISRHKYTSTKVEFADKVVYTKTTFHTNVVELVRTVLNIAPKSKDIIREIFRSNPRTGYLLAAANICIEGLSIDKTILDPSRLPPNDKAHVDLSYQSKRPPRPSENDRRVPTESSTDTDLSIASWTSLDLLAYQLMSSVLHYTLEQMKSSGLDRQETLEHLYERRHVLERRKGLEYNIPNTSFIVPSLSFQEIQEIANKFHATSTIPSRLALSDLFSGKGLRTFPHLSAPRDGALQVYLEICKIAIPIDNHQNSVIPMQSKEIPRKSGEEANTIAIKKNLTVERLPQPSSTTSEVVQTSYLRIIETWDIFDVIAFLMLHKYAKQNADRIGEALVTEVSDIELVVASTDYASLFHSSTWPIRPIVYQGRSGATSKMTFADIQRLTRRYMHGKQDMIMPVKLQQFLALAEKHNYEHAAIMLYCETFARMSSVMPDVGKGPIPTADSKKASSKAGDVKSSGINKHTSAVEGNPLTRRSGSTHAHVGQDSTIGQKRKLESGEDQPVRKPPKNWSMLNNIQKKSSREAAPRLEDLDLIPARLATPGERSNNVTKQASVKNEVDQHVANEQQVPVKVLKNSQEGARSPAPTDSLQECKQDTQLLKPDDTQDPEVATGEVPETIQPDKLKVERDISREKDDPEVATSEIPETIQPDKPKVERDISQEKDDPEFVLSFDSEEESDANDGRRLVRTRDDDEWEADDDDDLVSSASQSLRSALTHLPNERTTTGNDSNQTVRNGSIAVLDTSAHIETAAETNLSEPANTSETVDEIAEPIIQLSAASWANMLKGQGIHDSMLYRPMFVAFLQAQMTVPSSTNEQELSFNLIDALLTAIQKDPIGVDRSQFTGFLHTFLDLSGSVDHGSFLASTFPGTALGARYEKIFST